MNDIWKYDEKRAERLVLFQSREDVKKMNGTSP